MNKDSSQFTVSGSRQRFSIQNSMPIRKANVALGLKPSPLGRGFEGVRSTGSMGDSPHESVVHTGLSPVRAVGEMGRVRVPLMTTFKNHSNHPHPNLLPSREKGKIARCALRIGMRNSVWLILFLLVSQTVCAGQLSLGGEFVGWSANYQAPANDSGYEWWAPLSVNFKLDPDFSVYGQTEFGSGSYTDPISGTANLTDFSDTVIGGELHFQSFALPSMLSIGLNLPTGDPTWETKQITASIPTELVDSRYRGRGFGTSAFYGLSFPSGGGEFGAAAGYMYAGAFNPSYGGAPINNLKIGDSAFLALNHVQPSTGNQSEIIRLSAYYSLPSQNAGQNLYQLGANFNASYSWSNPSALSFEVGAQYWMAGQIAGSTGNWTPESNAYFGPRLYFDPSYSFGDFNVAGRLKYVLANGNSQGSPYYDGGGFLGGIEPSYKLGLDASSDIKVYGSFDYVAWLNGAFDINNNRTNVIYNLWTFGATYEVKL